MSNQEFLNQTVTIQSAETSYTINKANGATSDEIQVTVIGDHLAYTGGYGNAIMRMSGTKGILSVIGAHSNDEYLLSKVVTSDMENNEARQALMCDVLRHLAANQ